MTEYYMSVSDIARMLGLTRANIATIKMPEPDVVVGRARGWKKETILEWDKERRKRMDVRERWDKE